MVEELVTKAQCRLCGAPLSGPESAPAGLCANCRPASHNSPMVETLGSAAPYVAADAAFVGQLPFEPPAEYDPDRPPWGAMGGLGVWGLSFAAILIIPLIFALVAGFIWVMGQQAKGVDVLSNSEALSKWLLGSTSILVQVVATLVAHLLTIAVCWVLVTGRGRRPFWSTLGWKWQGRSTGYKILFVVIVMGVIIGVTRLLDKVMPSSKETIFEQILKASQTVRIALSFLAVFTAPLVEEVVYRGVVYSGLRTRLSPYASVLAVTGLFAGVHFFQYWGSWSSLAGIVFLSLVLTTIRAGTKSLFPCFLIHTVVNAIAVVAILQMH
jgi:membrane protease YdiL (CAAX protease family)